jgi:hypothetical protein
VCDARVVLAHRIGLLVQLRATGSPVLPGDQIRPVEIN